MEIFENPKKVDEVELEQLIRLHKDMQISEYSRVDRSLKAKSFKSQQRYGSNKSMEFFSHGKYLRGSIAKSKFCPDTNCNDRGRFRSNSSDYV